ncbi:MupA/Atu3671 family FMN-dependent luciferase-like monooxygenase [Micromonospora echinospora]
MDMSLFYFSADARGAAADRYRLLMEGARFADTHGFAAVWTPERHFHPFGGNYPNPAVTSAAIAATTHSVAVRAGSVVVPLHHVLRIAEDWAVVDNLAGGRAGISLASGWNRDDFLLRPGGYEERARLTRDAIDVLRRLWRGEELPAEAPGAPAGPRIYPLPVAGPLPMWLTTGGSPQTFRDAGRAGVGVLTHLANQDPAELSTRIADYRQHYEAAGWAGRGHVVLMLHTYLDRSRAAAVAAVDEPLYDYLVSAMNLFQPSSAAGPVPSRALRRLAVRPAHERYLNQGLGLFGTVDDAESVVARFRQCGVDEIACLIDFGVPAERVLDSFQHLDGLRRRVADVVGPAPAPQR